MSYILDALKKAEKERGTARIPNLAITHDPRGTRRNRLVTVGGALLVCAAAAFLLFFLSTLTTKFQQPKPSPATAERVGSSPDANSASSPLVQQVAQAPSGSARLNDASASGATGARSGSRSSVASPADAAARNTLEGGRRVNPVAQGESPIQRGVAEQATAPPIEPAPTQPVMNPANPAGKEIAPGARADQTPASLEEAVARMTLNILVYYDAESDRKVIINGKRYTKGDLVDGKYLIESITQEGAILTFEGARALLRPGR